MNNITYDDSINGEPELLFRVNEENFVRLWSGTFNNLMNLGKPQQDGKWDDLLLHFHMVDGFYDEANWQVPSVKDYRNYISNIEVPADNGDAIIAKKVLLSLFDYALSSNLSITISYS
jgi:hypothetical protein